MDTGLGFVVVTHISPDRASLLDEVVARYTTMPVVSAEDGIEVSPDTVYVLPSSASITLRDGRLRVVPTDRGQRERHPIDVFLASLARDCGDYAASIVLSGGDGDGTLGTKAVKERGGLTLAQAADGHGPSHSNMPRSAIATGLVDLAVPVEEMGIHLAAFARALADADMAEVSSDTSDGAGGYDEGRHEIYSILRNQVGHDFAGYKVKTFDRRVGRRMQVAQLDTLEGYVELLRREPREAGALFRDLLINVTNFFRDTEAFDKLAEIVVPRLLEGREADDVVRVWVPGCATGEEVYSVAILLREGMERMSAAPRVQIFATDIDERALAIARAGRYPEGLLDNLTPERRRRYFIRDGASFVPAREVRDLCIFSPHSVIRDPPFSRIDLVSCRNLLIYFGVDVQHQVIPTFHYALKPGGYLFLGTSESVSQFGELFTPIDKKQRIFRSRDDHSAALRLPTLVSYAARVSPASSPALSPQPSRPPLGGAATMRQAVERQVLERFAPAHVVATRDGDVVYYSARTGKYLEPAAGAPTRQLVNMARKGLRLDLRTAFAEAVERQGRVTREGLAVETEDGRIQLVTLSVEPLAEAQDDKPLFLVLFADEGSVLSRETALTRAQLQYGGAVAHLEIELRETRERLQSLIEEYETALEELKSSNEEMVSVNEELQSTNEELEASKEELQSLNEELHTVNAELNLKLEALDRANGDLRNLFESTPLATVFLDRHLVIRSFTPAVTEIFNILPGDRGRPLTDLASRVGVPDLSADVAAVFASGRTVERTPDRTSPGPHLLVRLAPYRGAMERIDGVVVTFVDISTLIRAEQRQQVLIDELLHRTRNLLVVVRSIARQTLGRGGTVEGFSERLSALGRVQNLVSRAATDTVDLRDLIALELEAQGAPEGGRVELAGPAVALRVEQVQTLALAVHELVTNAAKHGALTAPEGRLSIRWHVAPAPEGVRNLVLDWVETGVALPPVGEMRHGYGRELIERALPFDLGARTRLEFGPDGVHCHMEITLDDARDGGLS